MNFEGFKHNKSQERLQAQAEDFADKGVKNFSEDQAQILKYSAELAKIKDLNNLPDDLPEELVALIERNKDAYVNFLHQERNLETSFVEENIRNYREKFQAVIAELKAKMAQGNFKELTEYLGSGNNGSAFRIEVGGKEYAAKFSRKATQQNFEIKALIRAKGIPHTSQLVSYSFEDGVVIMEFLQGSSVADFTQEDVPTYTDENIIQLIDTVRELNARGLVIDPVPSNFLYDERDGFFVLDYHLKGGRSRYDLSQQVSWLKDVITARRFDDSVSTEERYRIILPIIIRFLKILKERYSEIFSDWQQQYNEGRNNPRISVPELIDRKYMPEDLEIQEHLKKLEEMGF